MCFVPTAGDDSDLYGTRCYRAFSRLPSAGRPGGVRAHGLDAALPDGLGLVAGSTCPHYDGSAVVFRDGAFVEAVT